MSFTGGEAEQKFWRMPELVEKLLLLLHPLSSLRLLQTGIVEKQVLRESLSSKAWNHLIRQCSFGEEGALQRTDLKNVVQILKLVELEDSSAFLLPLLDLICEKFPPPNHNELWMGEVRGEVQIACPCRADPHNVSLDGFLLLEEEVEGVFGTAYQSIKSVDSKYNLCQPFLSALSSRISRQESAVSMVTVGRDLEIENKKGARAFSSLLHAQEVKMTNLKVAGEIGEEGWQVVARAMQTRPSAVSTVWTSKEGLEVGRKVDIKEIWEAVKRSFFISDTTVNMGEDDFFWSVRVEKPKHSWKRLEQILEMSWGQFFCELEEERVERELEFERDDNLIFDSDDFSDDYSDSEEEYTEDESEEEGSGKDRDRGEGDEEEGEDGDGKDGGAVEDIFPFSIFPLVGDGEDKKDGDGAEGEDGGDEDD